MKKYSIVYENLCMSEGANKYLSRLSPPEFSINPKDAVIFDFVSEATMLFELEEYRKCDEYHLEGKVMERAETLKFKDIQ